MLYLILANRLSDFGLNRLKAFPEMKLSDFVLSKMSDTELKSLESKKEFFLDAIFNIFENGVVATMNIINQTKTSQPTQ